MMNVPGYGFSNRIAENKVLQLCTRIDIGFGRSYHQQWHGFAAPGSPELTGSTIAEVDNYT